jgi:glucose-6-phosphate-specific signal transduction histidine kinase
MTTREPSSLVLLGREANMHWILAQEASRRKDARAETFHTKQAQSLDRQIVFLEQSLQRSIARDLAHSSRTQNFSKIESDANLLGRDSGGKDAP